MIETVQTLWDGFWAIPHIRLALSVVWLVYLVGLGLWIALQKREPAATLSWMISLAALPYVGFLVYYVFGPQKIKRHRKRRLKHQVALPAHEQSTGEVAELGRLAQASTDIPATTARDIRLLVDGGNKYPALLADIAAARHHVHLEYYIYQPDQTGIALRDALVERAKAGVVVRVLVDAMGSSKAGQRFFAPLLEAGGEVAWFHPVRLWKFWSRPWLNMRTHRKIVVIDGRIAYTGGINITDEEDDRLRTDAYRDLHMRIEGDAVRALQAVFVEDWSYTTHKSDFVDDLARTMPESQRGDIHAHVLTSGPDSAWEPIHRLHVGAIHAASERVWLLTPYFVPGEAAIMALTSAALGGLDVRLLVPKISDSRLVTLCVRSYFDQLLAAGVKIYEYGPRMLHTKALLVDDSIAIIGTANFDNRSFRLNFEVSVLIDDAGIAGELDKLIQGEFANAPRVRDDRAQPLLRARIPEALARLMSPLL